MSHQRPQTYHGKYSGYDKTEFTVGTGLHINVPAQVFMRRQTASSD
jgi:hypothetical protein